MSTSYSENAKEIYRRLYMLENEQTISDVHERVAKAIATNENQYKIFLDMLNNKVFRPNSPCLMNAGIRSRESHKNNLCACFVYGLKDDMLSITNFWKTAALIYSSGGGIGAHIGELREKGSRISTGGHSSGPISFMKVIQTISEAVKSGGRTRRAANFMSMRYNHPDIMEFIEVKTKHKLTAINISVLVDKEFFKAVNQDSYVNLISPNGNVKVGEIKAREIWNNICEKAWQTGDPGLLFYDAINNVNPLVDSMPIVSTNPCGEIPLPGFFACNLGSINLNTVIKEGTIDYSLFEQYIEYSTIFLNNVIDVTGYPHVKFRENMLKYRPIGLGIMGYADILIDLGIPYNESSRIFSDICKKLTQIAYITSIELAKTDQNPIQFSEIEYKRMINLLEYYELPDSEIHKFEKYGIKNIFVTSIAPTGSISLSADCSYSFEPHFAIVWKKVLTDTKSEMLFILDKFKPYLKRISEETKKTEEEILNDIVKNKGSIQNIDYIPDNIKRIFKTALDISPIDKLKIQSAGQRYITLGISSTCNLPNSATIQDVENIYLTAYELNLKGITVFRDGCLDEQPVIFGGKKEKDTKSFVPHKKERPMIRYGKTVEVKTPKGTLYVIGNYDEQNNLIEIFLQMGKQNSLTSVLLGTIGRILSRSLQYGVPVKVFIDTMSDVTHDPFWVKIMPNQDRSIQVQSVIDLIAKILQVHFLNENINLENIDKLEICPQCNSRSLSKSIGCRGGTCLNCGFSNCS